MARSRSRTSSQSLATAPSLTPYSVEAIKSHLVPYVWDFAAKYIQKAIAESNGEMWLEDVYSRLLKEQMFLFLVKHDNLTKGAAVCEVIKYPRKLTIRVVYLGGETGGLFLEWRWRLHSLLKSWAIQIGADSIETFTRPGMAKMLKAGGYKQVYVGMELTGKKANGNGRQ